jgi:hypothetical protein
MVVNIRRVCEKVSKQKNVILDIEPFFKPDVTRIHLAKIPEGEEMERIAGFDFQADLLAYISENDLYQYLSIQIDRVLAGLPAQSIRLS